MGKAIMFMVFVWMSVSIAGGVAQGAGVRIVATTLTTAIDDDDTTITVSSTEGFAVPGFIVIGDERIGYSATTSTTFHGSAVNPVVRGASGTTAVDHTVGTRVRTVESSMINNSMDYKMAVIADSSGLWAAVTVPYQAITLLGTFLVLPIGFLGTDLQILTYLWGVLSVGLLVAFGVAMAGGRRV